MDVEPIQELLIDQLNIFFTRRSSWSRHCPRWPRQRARGNCELFEVHLGETEAQVERLNESLRLLGAAARAKPCKGMAGLVEEGEEVMDEGKQKDDGPAGC